MGPDLDSNRSFDYSFTIFTPTYNRAEPLKRVYESLREQTREDFEWLIVDDSSTDDTADFVERWQDEADFPIRFHVQEQPGKHRAYNAGIERARGRLIVGLDSDDVIFPNALERMAELWEEIPDGRDDVVGINCLCTDENGDVHGSSFPEDRMFANYFELRYVHEVTGDGIGCNRTSVLQQYPFPTPEGVRYVPESIVGSEIATEYVQYCVNESLGVYHSEDESGRSDQLTGRRNFDDAPGFVLWHRHRLNEHLQWFRHDPGTFLISAIGYARHSFHAGDGPLEQGRQLSSIFARLLWLFALPIGFAVYVRDRAFR